MAVDKVDESMIPDRLIAQTVPQKRCASAMLPQQSTSPERANTDRLGSNRSFFSLLSESIAAQRSLGRPLYPSATSFVAGVKALFPSIAAERTRELDGGFEKIISYFSTPRSSSASAHPTQQAKSVSPYLEREYPIPSGLTLDVDDDDASRGNETAYSVSEISQILADDREQERGDDDRHDVEEWGTHSTERAKPESTTPTRKGGVNSEESQESQEHSERHQEDDYITEIIL